MARCLLQDFVQIMDLVELFQSTLIIIYILLYIIYNLNWHPLPYIQRDVYLFIHSFLKSVEMQTETVAWLVPSYKLEKACKILTINWLLFQWLFRHFGVHLLWWFTSHSTGCKYDNIVPLYTLSITILLCTF